MRMGSTQSARFFAFLGDSALFYILYQLLHNVESFLVIKLKLTDGIALLLSPSLTSLLFFWLFIHWCRFYSALILGNTPIGLLLGLRVLGAWWSVRLVLPVKVVLDIVLQPLLFTGFVSLWSKKNNIGESSLSEVILGIKQVQMPENIFQSIGSFFVFPLFIFSFFSPLLSDIKTTRGLVIHREQVNLAKPETFSAFKMMGSKRFGFQWLTDLSGNRFSLWPDFQFVRVSTQLRLTPRVLILDKQREVVLRLSPGQEVPWTPWLQAALKQLGPRAERYNDILATDGGPLLPASCDRRANLIRQLISLRFTTLVGHLFEFGPFTSGAIGLRKDILGLVDNLALTQVDLIRLDQKPILRIRQERSSFAGLDSMIIHTFVPICATPARSFQISYQSGIKEALSYQDFLEQVVATTHFEDPLDHRVPFQEKEFHVFHLLDYLSEIDPLQKESFERGALELISSQVQNITPATRPLIEQSMSRLLDVIELISRRDKLSFSEPFKQHLQTLSKNKAGQSR
jgi:hypothetical protein